MYDNRDSLDYGEMKIPTLFRKLFVPTLLGLLAGAGFTIFDGIFIGRGVGAMALAAINVAAPAFTISTGIALMLASGVSVVAAVHLSKGNIKAANINITQSFTVGILLIATALVLLNISPETTTRLFGGSSLLVKDVRDYMLYVSPALLFMVIEFIGMFVMRLDGSPTAAMLASVISAILNIILDWLFIFPLGMGVKGAGIATSISAAIAAGIVIWYMLKRSKVLHLYRPKLSPTALRLTLRNTGYMIRLGLPTLLAELAICCMMIIGNFQFMKWLEEPGVAAFSVACYLFPLIFMFGNAIAQSALPIWSYNYGAGRSDRVRDTRRLAVVLSVMMGTVLTGLGIAAVHPLTALFLQGSGAAEEICISGLPYFLLCCLCFTPNIVLTGYYQSQERAGLSTVIMLLRGYVLVIAAFLLLPQWLGVVGLWLAVPASELATLLILGLYVALTRLLAHLSR